MTATLSPLTRTVTVTFTSIIVAVAFATFHFCICAIGGSVALHVRLLCWVVLGPLPALDGRQLVVHMSGSSSLSYRLGQVLIRGVSSSPTNTDDTLVPDLNSGDLDVGGTAKASFAASEYDAEIMEYITRLEPLTLPNPDYMISQPHLNWRSRDALVRWVFLTHKSLCSSPETLFLAINIADRFLGMHYVSAKRMRLLGAASLFVAAKMEDSCIPIVEKLVERAGGAFSRSDLIQAERRLLSVIEWNLSYSCPLNFIPRVEATVLCPCHRCHDDVEDADTLAKFFCEVGVADHHLIHVKPSTLAAAAVHLSHIALKMSVVSVLPISTCAERDIVAAVSILVDCLLSRPRLHRMIFNKYKSSAKRFHQLGLRFELGLRPKNPELTDIVIYHLAQLFLTYPQTSIEAYAWMKKAQRSVRSDVEHAQRQQLRQR